jgi:glycosyltransferase involved in cell wall biosynthesis
VRLVTAMLVRNEGAPDRYLRRVLARCAEFSDQILVLDDGSTDDTAEIASGCPKTLVKRRSSHDPAWGAEHSARAELWERGAKLAKDGWMLVADADMLLQGDPRPYCYSWELNAWAWPLLDLWDSETTFRVDGPWAGGPSLPRPWLFRPSALQSAPEWPTRGIHPGHAPLNFPLRCGVAPDLRWHHLAYLRKEHRERKLEQYMGVRDQLSPAELAHAASIND